MKQTRTYGISERLLAGLLSLCMVMSVISGAGLLFSVVKAVDGAVKSGTSDATQHIVADSRVADPNTMDTYLERLLTLENGSRYAGRVWTDKTVFAFDDGEADGENKGSLTNNTLPLDMATDGYVGNVSFNADFLHVFSALASSQVVNEYPPTPVDLVIVFDMSGSMGQDTRYELDPGGAYYVAHTENSQANGEPRKDDFPEGGVPMADRIANSRIQKTLDAINKTIDQLMAQNPQNRVAVCGYGANAVVLMPLGHYKRVDINNDGKIDESDPDYLTVGGMETLYHPSDLVYRTVGDTVMKGSEKLPEVENDGWYWMNNRDTCYTVVVNAEYNTYTGVLNKTTGDATGVPNDEDVDGYKWKNIKKTVSNNVLSDDGEQVKAFPGAWDKDGKTPLDTHKEENKKVYENTSSGNETWVAGLDGVLKYPPEKGGTGARTSELKEAMKNTSGLEADDYIGYFTNTQGGIYLAYKQLADSTATTYTETLTNGVVSTVARIPAAIIMSDGGANFSFNEMGQDDRQYTADDWNVRYGQRIDDGGFSLDYMNDNGWTNNSTLSWKAHGGIINDRSLVDGHNLDFKHRLNENSGDEWYKVFIPGKDTLEGWDGLHGIYNQGADITEDGTLSTPPAWNHAGIFYSSDNDVTGTAGTVMEVLLTASYMSYVVQTHYSKGWVNGHANDESKSELFTYTMNVDTVHVPLWGRMRLYPTLDPKEYNLENIDEWYNKQENNGKFGTDEEITNTLYYDTLKDKITKQLLFEGGTIQALGDGDTTDDTITGLKQAWDEFKNGKDTKGPNQINDNGTPINIVIKPIQGNGVTYEAGGNDKITVKNDDVVKNIAYNDEFFDVTSKDVGETFDRILALILGKVFVPVSGDNDAGVGDSITYQDPLGEYMEIKNGAIEATPHHIDDEEPRSEATYDMALLLFGEMHGLVRVGVYDWNWNNEWMEKNYPDQKGDMPFPMGWYRGDDPTDAEQPLETGHDDAGSYPTKAKDGTTYSNATEARADGWVYRVNFSTLLSFVPITGVDGTDPNVHPNTLPDQVKNAVYTLYRFAGSQADRNALHRNPIYGEVPDEVQAAWEKAYKDSNTDESKRSYPVGDEIYSGTPGVYRLSDIRVWVEDTGDFVDTTGAITPNTGYDRSLYVNIPAAAVPTELATITLGKEGVLSYETNLGSDHEVGSDYVNDKGEKVKVDDKKYAEYCYQSTPFRLFYAVGLEDDLILRDAETDEQIGVDFNKISPEYIQSHTVEGQDYVWFISNYYSETRYDKYATDDTSRTRGDPTVTFSPSADNRYYVFQKPLPLYAHAYRVQSDGTLNPVDGNPTGANKAGNGKTTWETYNGATQQANSWVGGQYMGTYDSADAFKDARANTTTSASISPGEIGMPESERYIKDSKGITYPYVENGIVFLEEDLLDHVTSNADGSYAADSVSFSSDDYFFILIEYYVPDEGIGKDNMDKEVPGTQAGHMVQYALARKGSEFGSGFESDNIDNGDMLCWTDTNNKISLEFDYMSKSDTGDRTRGEPTWEKLTYDASALRSYFQTECGISETAMMPNPDYDSKVEGSESEIKVLDYLVKYWTKMQKDEFVQAALEAAGSGGTDGKPSKDEFNAYFKFAVAARPGGVRSGDMSNNLQYKGSVYNSSTQLYDKNNTKTSNTYYLPTISDSSGTDNNVIINNYLGNNGRLEIANQMLHVTKRLVPPDGYELTKAQKDETFNYQIFIQGVTGTRTAVKTEYNEYSGTWDRQLAYIDVLTDNSDLVQTNNNERALFVLEETDSTLEGGSVPLARQVIQSGENYYYANDDGTLDTDADGNITSNPCSISDNNPLYYLYLPSNDKNESNQHVHRLYQNKDYNDTDKDNWNFTTYKNGTTTFVNKGQHEFTGTEPGVGNTDSYREASEARPAGTKTYWTQSAELIPKSEVDEAESANGVQEGEMSTLELGVWKHEKHNEGAYSGSHKNLTFHTFVIRKPSGETSETNFTSPFLTRSAYMTVELKFGKNANADDGSSTDELTADDLYDTVIPTTDRPDLFTNVANLNGDGNAANINAEYIAKHTAEFTLKHNEGLLLTGLDNRVAYRFTEKLTQKQIDQGYKLQEVSHIQQRGSESIYRLGIQEIPIYSYEGAKYGAEYGSASENLTENGLTWPGNSSATTPNMEPFAHTNAIMWEYYATMAKDASGNHHQPDSAGVTDEVEKSMQIWSGNPNEYNTVTEGHTVADNPNCKQWDPDTKTGCDVTQKDGSILHYMYREGQLIDPHYNGEASTYLRNMARYGVSPTVHFAVDKEPDQTNVPSTLTAGSTYKYTGVYSVFGNTGWFEEQVNYTNTFEPEDLTITKELEPADGTTLTEKDKATEFEFTLKLTKNTGAIDLPDTLGYTITDKGGNEVKGRLVKHDFAGATETDIKADETDLTWTFKLKGGQTMSVSNLTLLTGYTFTVTEVSSGGAFEVTDSETGESDTSGETTVSGTIGSGEGNVNSVTFTNTKTTPEPVTVIVPLNKHITENSAGFDWTDQEFTFIVTPDSKNVAADDPVQNQKDKPDEKVLTVTVNAPTSSDGKSATVANIFEGIEFTKAGTFVYTVAEQAGNIPGIKYSDKVYTVTIVVEEDYGEDGTVYTGKLKATVTITPNETVSFDNPYNEDEVTVPIKARKVLNNGTLNAGEFTFELVAEKYEPAAVATIDAGESTLPPLPDVPSSGGKAVQRNDADGIIDFGEITFTAEGTYTYTLHEVKGSDENIEYDDTVYTIVIKIGRDETTDVLTCTSVTVNGDPYTSDDYINVLNFTNEVITTGELSITKTVEGNGGEKDKEFAFTLTVTLPESVEMPDDVVISKTDAEGTAIEETLAFVGNTLSFTLKDGEKLSVTGLPIGTSYTVKEADYSGEFYSTEYSHDGVVDATGVNGTIALDPSAVTVTNTKNVGDLTVSKTVVNGDPNKEFNFTVTLDKPINGEFGDMEFTNGVATFTLRDGESKTAEGLPAGTGYTVTEDNYTSEGYTTTSEGASSSIPSGGVAEAKFTNKKPDAGKYIPTVQKLIEGTPKAGVTFTFKIEASTSGAPVPAENTVTITLDDNEKLYSASFGDITFSDAGTYVYTITEETTVASSTDFDCDESVWTLTVTVEKVGDQLQVTSAVYAKDGVTVTDAVAATFTNKRRTGDLTVSKTVTGDAGDKDKEFHFTVTLSDTTINGTYGDMTFTNGVASFTLKHNAHATATGLPANVGYTVTETEAGTDDYTTSIKDNDDVATDGVGTIEDGATDTVEFTNHKDKPKVGNLTVSKTVTGDGDKEKSFNFTVKLDDAITGKFGEMEFTDGVATFTLKDGESKTATGLPAGITYTVTETEADTDGYKTSIKDNDDLATDGVGTIEDGETDTVEFTNHKEKPKVGNLTVSKTVTGDGDKDKSFNFTVTLDDAVTGKFGEMEFTDGVATFTLKHGESKSATGLPAGVEYTVTETEANEDDYVTTATGDSGSIPADSTAEAKFTNHREPPPPPPEEHFGNLTVTKTVTGIGDLDKEWHFTVTLSDTTINGTYGDMTFTNGVAEFTLKHGESKTATNLPAGVTYTVTEAEANADDYDTSSAGASGVIPAESTAEAKFTNHKEPPPPEEHFGNLTVTKTVTGIGDLDKEWHFTVTLSDTTINGTYGDMTFTNGVAEFTLKHGESKTATNLPAGVTYTVTEAEANMDDYDTSSTGASGVIPAESTAEARFTNHKEPPPPPEEHYGNLIVTKTVTGIGDLDKEWHFTVTLSDSTINGTYGEMTFTNGVAEFTLKHGESKTATNLPAGVTYTVTEAEAATDGYTTNAVDATGVIPDGGTAHARFTNHKEPPPPPEEHFGNLTVTKTVTGIGDLTKDWHFTVTLSDTTINGTYGDMTFTNGVAEFTLKHGESKTATNLPAGVTYTVTEAEANADDYDTSSTGASGVIPADSTAEARFTNHKEPRIPKTGDDSHLGFWATMFAISMSGAVLTAIPILRRRAATASGRRLKRRR